MKDGEIPILCYVTDRRSLSVAPGIWPESALVEKIAAIAADGVDWGQIREKDLDARPLAALTRDAIAMRHTARVIVNDRLDVAINEGAGGLHLGESSLPISEPVRRVKRSGSAAVHGDRDVASQLPVGASNSFLIGASCHSLEGALTAVKDGADYIFFGPIFATPSKAKFGEPQGVKKLVEVCSAASVPVIAIGGITLDNAEDCVAAGAAGIAAIRLFQDAADPARIVSTLKKLR